MRFHHPLSYILDNRIKVDILRFLVRTGAEWNGREVAKELGISPAACHKSLKSLYHEGIIQLRATGNTHLYRLNRKHRLVVGILAPLFSREIGILDGLTRTITGHLKRNNRYFISLALFGSILRGQEKPASDIDLLVIIKSDSERSKAEGVIGELGNHIVRTTGNTLSGYMLTVGEFRRKYRKGLPIIRGVVRSHKLIRGKALSDLLRK
jgi:predicted nucleotidyltransferase/biotin operon repressor